MEESIIRYHTELTANEFINQLINNTHKTARTNWVNKRIEQQMPQHSINYMDNMAKAAIKHKNPQTGQRTNKIVITEPCESVSKMTRPHLVWDRSEVWRQHVRKLRHDGVIGSKKMSKMSCMGVGSSKSIGSRSKTTRKFHIRFSKRQAPENEPSPLIALHTQPEEHDQLIGQLRAKKIKLEQAFKFFLEQELKQSRKEEQRQKQKLNNNFTTDYRGKLINFYPRAPNSREGTTPLVRVQTLIDSSRMQGKLNLSATRRGFSREYFSDLSNKQI